MKKQSVIYLLLLAIPLYACYDYDSGEISLWPTDPRVSGGEPYAGYLCTCMYQPPVVIDLNLPPGMYDVSLYQYLSNANWSTMVVTVGDDSVAVPDLGSGGPLWTNQIGACGYNCGLFQFTAYGGNADVIIHGTGYNLYLLKARIRGNVRPVVSAVSPSGGTVTNPITLTCTSYDREVVSREEYQYQIQGETTWHSIGTDNTPDDPYIWNSGMDGVVIRIRARAYDNYQWSEWFVGDWFTIASTPPSACYDYDSGEINLLTDPRVNGGEFYMGYRVTCQYQPPINVDLNLPPGRYDVSFLEYNSPETWSTRRIIVGNDSVSVPDLGTGGPRWYYNLGSCGENCGTYIFNNTLPSADIVIRGTGFNVYLLKMRVRGNTAPVVTSISPNGGEYRDPLTLSANASDPGGITQIQYQYQIEGGSAYNEIGNDNTPSTPYNWNSGITNARIRLRARAQDNCGIWGDWYTGNYFIVDNLPPVTTDNIPAGWQNRDINVVLTRDDGPLGSGFDVSGRTYYSTDGSTPTIVGTTFTLTESRVYTIKYYSVDDVGNVEAIHTKNAYIDKIAPTFGPWTVPDIADTTRGAVNISVVVNDALSGVDPGNTILQYGIGSSNTASNPDIVGWTTFATGTSGSLNLAWNTYGNRYLYLRCIARDNATNSATSATYIEHIQIINRAPICYDIPDQTIDEKVNCGEDCGLIPGAIGYYYNLPNNHPEVEGPITGVVRGDNPFNHDWYSPRYFVFQRLDTNLNFGSSWWPVNTGLPGDPYYFAVHWVATLFAPETRTYNFQLISDDDAWVYIDGRMVADNGGIHPMTSCSWSTTLTKGYHTLHIYFAERHTVQSGFVFTCPGLTYGVFPEVCRDMGATTEFSCINLDDYVSDYETPDANIRWSVSGGGNIRVVIDRDRRACFTVLDDNWSGSETFTFRATDASGLYCTETVTMTVRPRNDCPIISPAIPSQTIYEGESFRNINLCNYAADPDNASSELSWTTHGGSAVTVTISGCTATINYPGGEWNGSESIWFIVSDPLGAADSQLVTFTVLPVNDPPVVSRIPDQTINEGESFADINLDDYVSDPDNPDDEIVWTVSGYTSLIVTVSGHIVHIAVPDSEYHGAETLTFTARDPEGLTASTTATFTVNAVNDAPVVSAIPDQTINEGETFAPINLDDFVYDIDNSDSELTWTITGAEHLLVTLSGHILNIAVPDSEWNGTEALVFTATDPGGLSDETTVLFTVRRVNDAPIITPPLPDIVMWTEEHPSITLDEYVMDVDNSDAELTWSVMPTHSIDYTIDPDTRTITFSTRDGFCGGSENIILTVTDPEGLSDTDTLTVQVKCSNPVATITEAPDTVTWGLNFTLCANINDELTGNSNIVYAEYHITRTVTEPTPGTGTEFMITYASSDLDVCAIISTTDYSAGKYRIFVRGRDAGGNWSNLAFKDIIILENIPPNAPNHLDASVCGRDVTLNWDPVVVGDLAGYNVYRRYLGETSYTRINTSIVTTNYYQDLNLPFDTTFFYVVTALDTLGNESDYSNEDSAYTYEVKVDYFSFRLLGNAKVRFYWSRTAIDSIYFIYYSEGDEPIDYSSPVAIIYAPDSTWTTPNNMLEAYHSYNFAIRVLAKCGYMDTSEGTIIGVVPLPNPNAVECEKVFIKIPHPGKRIDGNSVLVMAETNCDPSGGYGGIGDRYADISAVMFEYRLHGSASWLPIPAGTHGGTLPTYESNPDSVPPFFVHWDVTMLDEGIYDIRAVAYNRAGVPDPTPSYISVIIDHHHPDYIESEGATGAGKSASTKAHNYLTRIRPAGTKDIITASVGANNYTRILIPSDGFGMSAKANISICTPEVEACGFVLAGKALKVEFVSSLREVVSENAHLSIELPYDDVDNDGIVDGLNIRETNIGLYFYDKLSGSWKNIPNAHIDIKANRAYAYDISSNSGYFALLAPASPLDVQVQKKPESFALGKNYPNPFNTGTVIDYAVPNETQVAIEVYNIVGQKVRTLVNDKVSAGYHSVIWDGKDDTGNAVPSGIYFYTMTANKFKQVERMLFMK